MVVSVSKKRKININKTKRKHSCLKEMLLVFQKELTCLFNCSSLTNDYRFLRRVAICIIQIDYEAKNALGPLKSQAQQITHFLSTPIGAPFVTRTTLVQAALAFSEQEPHDSDLRMILLGMGKYGPRFSLQLMRIFTLL